jgi:hypothetical protein
MKNQKNLLVFALLALLAFSIPVVYADDEYDDDEWEGFGIMKQEREREHQDDDDNDKIFKPKRPKVQKSK